MNVVAFLVFVFFFHNIDLAKPLSELKKQLSAQTGTTALEYLACLYVLALLWGFASGLSSEQFGPRVLAYRLRLTPISPATTVFVDVLSQLVGTKENRRLRDDPARHKVAWLRIRRDNRIILGRVRKSSIRFGVNEPIEVYLSPACIFEGGAPAPTINPPGAEYVRGMYLRLRPDDVADILVARASWTPIPAPPAT